MSPRWKSSAPAVSSMRRPRPSDAFGFGGWQALARDRRRSCQFTSVEMVLLCSRVGLGDARKHSAAACSRRTWFSICKQQCFDRNAVEGGHGQRRRGRRRIGHWRPPASRLPAPRRALRASLRQKPGRRLPGRRCSKRLPSATFPFARSPFRDGQEARLAPTRKYLSLQRRSARDS